MSTLVDNQRGKLFATALNNLGVASMVTGGIVPATAYLLCTLRFDGPIALAASLLFWGMIGTTLIGCAQLTLKRLQ